VITSTDGAVVELEFISTFSLVPGVNVMFDFCLGLETTFAGGADDFFSVVDVFHNVMFLIVKLLLWGCFLFPIQIYKKEFNPPNFSSISFNFFLSQTATAIKKSVYFTTD
jgi:hypothetical protein